MVCEVESDIPYKMEWFRDGKLVDLKVKPPFPFVFSDGSGMSLVQWPYVKDYSEGTYACRASNGVDPAVGHNVTFTQVASMYIMYSENIYLLFSVLNNLQLLFL